MRDEIQDPHANLEFMESRVPALDALSTFVPTGQESDPRIREAMGRRGFARWYPVQGGHRVLFLYEGGEFDAARFTLERGAWDHEDCAGCGGRIEPMTLCWVTRSGPYVVLCARCHAARGHD